MRIVSPDPQTAKIDMTTRGVNIGSNRETDVERSPRRVVVAMSGGVDSSVAAALLKQQGHDVIGITLQLYDHGAASGRKGSCCAGQDIHDARRVADALSIPHYVLDYERRFEERVMGAFADSYLVGETPVPCIACNSQIKFTELLAMACDLGADALATGHYVDRRVGPAGIELYRAADTARDQSYFMFATTRAQLENLMFPLGGSTKAEVRDLGRSLGVPIADKPDSQDICFVPSGKYTDVIERLKPGAIAPGEIVHEDGRVLGQHAGIVHYTIGQRRGLGIASHVPLFVVRLDAATRQVIVGPRDGLATCELTLRAVNWLGDQDWVDLPAAGLPVAVRIRSTNPPQPARLLPLCDGGARVVLDEPELGVAAGQACVFYQDASPRARVLGGGWITKTVRLREWLAAGTEGRGSASIQDQTRHVLHTSVQ